MLRTLNLCDDSALYLSQALGESSLVVFGSSKLRDVEQHSPITLRRVQFQRHDSIVSSLAGSCRILEHLCYSCPPIPLRVLSILVKLDPFSNLSGVRPFP